MIMTMHWDHLVTRTSTEYPVLGGKIGYLQYQPHTIYCTPPKRGHGQLGLLSRPKEERPRALKASRVSRTESKKFMKRAVHGLNSW